MEELKEPVKTGRPTDYTKELIDEICSRLAMGESMRSVSRDEKMPSMTTLFRWLRENEEFQKQYAQAKQESAHADDEMLQEIGDEAIKESKEVGDKRANAVVSAYKLKADNLKWAMSKKMPKKYGDKIDMTTNGKDLPAPILGFVKDALPSDNSNKESAGDEVSDQGSTGGNVGVEDSVDRPLLDTLSPIGQDANAD